jgi:hypothetical protein
MMNCPPGDSTATSVYRYYDQFGVLLYVGITKQGIGRNRQHNADKVWWQWVTLQEVDHFDSRDDAHAREVALIRKYRPPFNVQHNTEHRVLSTAYIAARESGIDLRERAPKEQVPLELVSQVGRVCVWRTRPINWLQVAKVFYSEEKRPQITVGAKPIGAVSEVEKDGISMIVTGKIGRGFKAYGEAYMTLKWRDSRTVINRVETFVREDNSSYVEVL